VSAELGELPAVVWPSGYGHTVLPKR
jgi:hypothetical protein